MFALAPASPPTLVDVVTGVYDIANHSLECCKGPGKLFPKLVAMVAPIGNNIQGARQKKGEKRY